MWTLSHVFSLAVAELLVIGATSRWPPLHQTLAICAVFLFFVATHFGEDED